MSTSRYNSPLLVDAPGLGTRITQQSVIGIAHRCPPHPISGATERVPGREVLLHLGRQALRPVERVVEDLAGGRENLQASISSAPTSRGRGSRSPGPPPSHAGAPHGTGSGRTRGGDCPNNPGGRSSGRRAGPEPVCTAGRGPCRCRSASEQATVQPSVGWQLLRNQHARRWASRNQRLRSCVLCRGLLLRPTHDTRRGAPRCP